MSASAMMVLYVLWLAAGTLDFHFHRRTDLPHTSGLRESTLHGVQLALVGTGVLAWLLLADTRALAVLLAVLAAAHAIAGYLDTASADGRRRISPAEQHVHSVLDVAPWLFVLWVAHHAEPAWALQWRPAPAQDWVLTLLPAMVVALSWLWELLHCLRADRSLSR
ncbi:hypothetical protein [Stenotrophomonas maltophilia]|uniref:hypothetical protein n=1 Tax=Stenotrophomonas maltophilia TaxID=40324 RepID=UPI0007EFB187|nr:hypothetical protein [Stenotrophomonas maltophilia]OBU51720.1 hypothetical protein A9K76_03835 [Stenotrophomonas maltophilia]